MSHQDFCFERRMTALLQTNGYYVERNRKTPRNSITETDAVAIRFAPEGEQALVVEYKNSDVTCTDVLKAKGRESLFQPAKAVVVASGHSSGTMHFEDFCERLGVLAVTGATDAASAAAQLQQAGLTSHHDAALCQHWEQAYILEDCFKRILIDLGSLSPRSTSPVDKAYQYLWGLDCDMWWRYDNPWSRATLSYRLHFAHQRVAQEVAAQYAAAAAFCRPGHSPSPREHLKMAYRSGVCPPAQAALYVQTRARITALAVACECALSEPPERPSHTAFLSSNFNSVVQVLERNPELASGLVAFLQTWIFSWGGFIIDSQREREYQLIAADIGQPAAYVPRYLELLEELLQVEPAFSADFRGGWRHVIPNAYHPWRVDTLKLLPEPLKGLGVRRRRSYLPADTLRELPDFYRDWEGWVDSYITRLVAAEDGTAPYDWGTIESTTAQERPRPVLPR